LIIQYFDENWLKQEKIVQTYCKKKVRKNRSNLIQIGYTKLLIALIHACLVQFEVICDLPHETNK
jgi:hypothetical protein